MHRTWLRLHEDAEIKMFMFATQEGLDAFLKGVNVVGEAMTTGVTRYDTEADAIECGWEPPPPPKCPHCEHDAKNSGDWLARPDEPDDDCSCTACDQAAFTHILTKIDCEHCGSFWVCRMER